MRNENYNPCEKTRYEKFEDQRKYYSYSNKSFGRSKTYYYNWPYKCVGQWHEGYTKNGKEK